MFSLVASVTCSFRYVEFANDPSETAENEFCTAFWQSLASFFSAVPLTTKTVKSVYAAMNPYPTTNCAYNINST